MSIRLKLLIILAGFTVVPVAIVGAWFFSSAQASIEAARLAQLGNTADLKVERIETYFAERSGDVRLIAQMPTVTAYLEALGSQTGDGAGPSRVPAGPVLDRLLKGFHDTFGHRAVVLLDRTGRIVYAAGALEEGALGRPYPRPEVFEKGSQRLFLSEAYLTADARPVPEMTAAAPVVGQDGHSVGVVAVELGLEPAYPQLHSPLGLGETGEVVIGRRDGDAALVLVPLRSDPDAALRHRLPFTQTAGSALQRAVMGESGSGIVQDYRGVEVLAAWRYLPELGWGLVAKIDASEALAPVRKLRNLMLSIVLGILLVSGAVAVLVARSVSHPILSLQRGAEAVTAGNLDVPLATEAHDEVGALSRAFATMTRSLAGKISQQEETAAELQRSHQELERRVAERTEALSLANQALRRAGEYNRSLIEASLDPLVTIAPDGTITDVNSATELVTGRSRAELVGTDFSDYFTEPDRAGSGYRQVLAEGAVRDYPLEIRDRDGRVTPVLYNASLYRDQGGEVVGIFAAARDVSARRRAEAEVARTLAELQRSNAELEQFAYVASHDLQEPLRMISSYVQLLARRYRGALDSDADDFIGFAVEGADRMQRMINDLLALSRVGTRGRPLESTASEQALAAAVSNLQLAVEESGAVVTHEPLPVVEADPGQLVQLFQNLVGNAIKFKGSAAPVVRVSAADEGSQWVFSVEDNGIGIAPEYAERIFVIFQRLHGRTEYPGTGIGLAMCRKIVERHGGRIWVEPRDGGGSTFRFCLPKQGASEA